MASTPLPVTLVAGFLGSGKTTFLNRVLAGEHGRRVAVLVNDFGSVSIDAALVAEASETAITLTNGCICCALRDDLVGAVRDLVRRVPPPEHLVVELSGIADPGNVLRSFALMEKTWPLHVDGVVALVDAEQFPEEGERHYLLAREQLVLADVILLNKADRVSRDQLAELRRRIVTWVPTARIVETVLADVPLELCLGLGADPERVRDLGPAVAPSDEHGFATFTYRSSSMLALSALRATCTELPPWVFRAKGFVHLDARPEHRTVLQIVGRRARIDLGEPWGERPRETVIVFIGAREGFEPEELRRAFDACVATRADRVRPRLSGALEWLRDRFSARRG